jgi:hypothetical protein
MLNRFHTGEATAQVRTSIALFPFGFRQIFNLVLSPLMETSGLAQIAFHVHQPALKGLFFIPALAIWLLILLVLLQRRKTLLGNKAVLLGVCMTLSVWAFLTVITVLLGYQCDWTTQSRYSFPVAFGWLCAAITFSFNPRASTWIRGALAVAWGVPFAATVIAVTAKPVFHAAPSKLPRSHLEATAEELSACSFLQAQLSQSETKPALILADEPYLMNELGVPVVPWFYLERHGKIYSSKPAVVWAILKRSSSDALKKRLDDNNLLIPFEKPPGVTLDLLSLRFK